MLIELFMTIALAASSQKERCTHADYEPTSDMICVDRNGHCTEVSIDGHTTTALTDEALASKIHAIKHGEDVCWQIAEPVSTKFRVQAKAGGIRPSFVGDLEQISVILYSLDDYDPATDSRLDSLNGISVKPDGKPNGTWQVQSERPLQAGEYVAVIRVSGAGNWDRQAVFLKLDPKATPSAADPGK